MPLVIIAHDPTKRYDHKSPKITKYLNFYLAGGGDVVGRVRVIKIPPHVVGTLLPSSGKK